MILVALRRPKGTRRLCVRKAILMISQHSRICYNRRILIADYIDHHSVHPCALRKEGQAMAASALNLIDQDAAQRDVVVERLLKDIEVLPIDNFFFRFYRLLE